MLCAADMPESCLLNTLVDCEAVGSAGTRVMADTQKTVVLSILNVRSVCLLHDACVVRTDEPLHGCTRGTKRFKNKLQPA